IDAHAKGEPVHLLRVIANKTVHGRVHHSCPKEFNPARSFALPAVASARRRSRAAAENARHIELHRWLREREIAGPEARRHARTKELLYEILDRSSEIAKSNVSIDRQTLYLVKRERMRSVRIIPAIHLARHNDSHRRLALLHCPNLHRRSMCTQQQLP